MEQTPLVSILLLSMNHESFIEKCISSLKEQTYKNIEVIYLDNASSDQTFEIGKQRLIESGIPCKYFSNNESKGISRNLNFLLENSNGSYICPLSTDDWLTIDSISEKITHFINNPGFGMVYNSAYSFNYNTGETHMSEKKSRLKEGWILKYVLKENCIITTGCMIKRKSFEVVGNFDEKSPLEDWDMWIRIAEKFPIGLVNKELAYYGIKEGNNITGNIDYMSKGFEYILEKYAHYDEIKEAKKHVVKIKIYHYATNKPSAATLKYILKNYKFDFFYFKQLVKTAVGIVKKRLTYV